MALQTFDIPKRSRTCSKGGEEFGQGTKYYSLLEPNEEGGYNRKDFCPNCWEQDEHIGKIYWKSAVPIKSAVSDQSLRRDERALELLKEVYQSEEEDDLAQAFVLALLLSRSKILQLKQEVEGVLLYEITRQEEMIGIKKVELSKIETDKVKNLLAEKLGSNE